MPRNTPLPQASARRTTRASAPALQGPLRDRLTGRPLTGRLLTGRLGPYRKPLTRRDGPYGKGRGPVRVLHREGRRRGTGRPLTGRLLTRRPLTNYRKAYGKLWGETLPELGGNFRLCAVDQKRPFFPRAGPFLDLLPFQGPFPLTGALTGRPVSYEKTPYELQESLREATGRDFTRIGREFRLCAVDQKKPFFPRAGPFLDLSAL